MSRQRILKDLVVALIIFQAMPGGPIDTGSTGSRTELAYAHSTQTSGQEPAATLSFELYNNFILVPVRANGSQPLSFILDTGASMSFLSERQALVLGLVVNHEKEGNFGTGEGESKIGFARDVNLDLGGLSMALKVVAVTGTGGLESVIGRRLDGIAGAEFFRRYVVEVDYDALTLRLYKPEAYVYKGSGEMLPLTLAGGRPFVKASVAIAGVLRIEGKFILDLGDNRALELNSPFVRKHGILSLEQNTIKNVAHGLAGGAPELLGRLDSFQMGRAVLKHPVVAFSTATRGSTSDASYDGVIGTEIFRRFKLIFDYSRNRMILEPGAAMDEVFDIDMLGVSWLAKGTDFKTLEIESVKESSPAAQAGLVARDIIISIDGRPATEISLDQIKRMFGREGKEYVLGIRRREEILEIKVKTRRLI